MPTFQDYSQYGKSEASIEERYHTKSILFTYENQREFGVLVKKLGEVLFSRSTISALVNPESLTDISLLKKLTNLLDTISLPNPVEGNNSIKPVRIRFFAGGNIAHVKKDPYIMIDDIQFPVSPESVGYGYLFQTNQKPENQAMKGMHTINRGILEILGKRI